ncbi:putative hydrolase [Xylariales sp. PMI_506]|nr:putative hydrolase [Xylariales sp. PMI_506]
MVRIAIINALVFDGYEISGPRTVIIDGTHISDSTAVEDGDTVVDGSGCTLLPGLFDCHVHITTPAKLASYASFGITTVCDMACWPIDKYNQMRSAQGPTHWLGTSLPAIEESSRHGKIFKFLGVRGDFAIHDPDGVPQFVADRIGDGVDYIKVIADVPGHHQDVLNRIAEEARKHEKMTVAHTAQYDAFQRGLDAGFDILTHVPLDKVLGEDIAERMGRQKTVAVPTLCMMEMFTVNWAMRILRGSQNFQNAIDSVTIMHKAGVPILAGTDANDLPLMKVEGGRSLHCELEHLVRAGLTPIEALRSATSLPAKHFNLYDRGNIKPGHRADLILVQGNPAEDIKMISRIRKVWSGGNEIQPAPEGGGCAVM